jgi:hypothetical protein
MVLLNDGQSPNPNVVRVAPGTGYHRVEGNRRASRNGPVSDLPPENPYSQKLCIAAHPAWCVEVDCSNRSNAREATTPAHLGGSAGSGLALVALRSGLDLLLLLLLLLLRFHRLRLRLLRLLRLLGLGFFLPRPEALLLSLSLLVGA